MPVNMKCPECKSSRVWKKGYVPARGGPKARYVCFDCGRSFYKGGVAEAPKPAPSTKKRGRAKGK